MRNSPKTIGFLQALGVAVYVIIFSVAVQKIQQLFISKDLYPKPALSIVFFLLAFIISALICWSVVFVYPIILFFKEEKDTAWKIFLWTGIWLILFFFISALVIVSLVLK